MVCPLKYKIGSSTQAQRLERERLRLKAEFEAELQAKKEKEAAQQKMNEELKRAAEERFDSLLVWDIGALLILVSF